MSNASAIPWARPELGARELAYLTEAFHSSWISGGPFVDRLEAGLRETCKVPHALCVSNGTTAIHLAYLALGIGAGDEVIVPGFGFMAAANIALLIGATPVFAEVDPETWCLDPADVARRITPRTKAIVPVHSYGNMCDMTRFEALAKQAGVALIEDAAEAFCSKHRGRAAGSIGLLGTVSFHATKTITTGEGGVVFTHDGALADKMRLYRSHGMNVRRYFHEVPGHNFRLTNLQAAIGLAQLEGFDRVVRERDRIRRAYQARLSTLAGVTLQCFAPEVDPVLWSMVVRLDPAAFPQGRDAVFSQLLERGIETRPGFYPASSQSIYECTSLPICEAVSASVLCLPTFTTLSDGEIDRVVDELARLRG